MKKLTILISIVFILQSCTENAENQRSSTIDMETSKNTNQKQTDLSQNDLELSMKRIGKLINVDKENQNDSSPEEEALDKLLEMAGGDKNGSTGSIENMFSTNALLDMLEASGASRAEMEKLISNPDSLRILAQEARKNREKAKQEKSRFKNKSKSKISQEQLTSKNTPTGISIKEAILIVQAESGPEATIEKLKKIDSLAGTNVMEQIDFNEAGYVLSDVARENEPKASLEEEKEMEALRKLTRQLHSDKEAEKLLVELETLEKDIESGAIKGSPEYKRTISRQKNRVRIFSKDFNKKAKIAKAKFQKLNPDLYFGEEVGATYVGHMKKTVYLPLGKLSFVDKVIKANHPLLLTNKVNNVIGEPDVILGYLPDDITGIHSLGLGGDLTVQFIDNALTNVNGPDLYIFEIGQIEPTDLEISKDGKNWIKVGKIDGGVAEVDIGPYVKQGELFYYVRLKDLETYSGIPGADIDAIAAIGAAMRLNLDSKVLFDSGKSVLKPTGIEAIRELASSIKILKSGTVIVEGHTDDVGSKSTNQRLSLARAKSVSAELKKQIPSSSFKWKEKGLGESKPLVENDSDLNRSKNRRVEILVLPN